MTDWLFIVCYSILVILGLVAAARNIILAIKTKRKIDKLIAQMEEDMKRLGFDVGYSLLPTIDDVD